MLDPRRVALRNADGELVAIYLAWHTVLELDNNRADPVESSPPVPRLNWRAIWSISGAEPSPRAAPIENPTVTALAPGDADADGVIGQHDAAVVMSEWGRAAEFGVRGDLNSSGAVGMDDLILIVEGWGKPDGPVIQRGILDVPPPYFPCWCCPHDDCLVACLPPATCLQCCRGGSGPGIDPTDDNPNRDPGGGGDDDSGIDNPGGGGGGGDPPNNGGGGGGDPPGGTDCENDGDCDGICDADDCDSSAYTGSSAACEDDDLDGIQNQDDVDSAHYRRPRPGVDVRIDSNNDGAINDADEDEENRPGSLGHIVRAGDGDHDGDGIPDYADGFDAFECAECDDDDESPGSRFVRLKLFVRSGSLNDGKIAIDYSASDPAELGAGGSPSGYLRLWKKDGSQRRNKLPIVAPERGETGDYIPPGSYEPNDLGLSPHGGEVTLFLEVIRLSTAPGDLVISAHAEMHNCGDSASLTSYRVSPVLITETSISGVPTSIPLSHPSPTIALAQAEFVNLRPSEDLTRLLADIVVSGTIDDAASDLIDGADGIINSVQLLINGEPPITPGLTRGGIIPEFFIDVSSTKSVDPQSVLKPYDYSGSFARLIEGVEVQPGMNEIKIITTNAYGYAGSAERGVEVLAIPPPDEDYHISIDTLGNDPFGSKGYPIVVTLTINGVTQQATLEATAPGLYEAVPGAAGAGLFGMIVRFVPGSVLTPGQVDEFIARVTIPDTLVQDEEILFIETGPDTNTITGDTFVEEAMRPDWRAYQITPGQLTPISATGPGLLHAFGLRFDGPEELKDLLQSATIDTLSAGPREYQIVEFDGHHLLANALGERPAAWLALDKSLQEPAQFVELGDPNNGNWEYVQGFGAGFVATGTDIVDGVVSVAKCGWYVVENYNTVSVVWRIANDEDVILKEDQERIAAAGEMIGTMADVAVGLAAQANELALAILTGDEERLEALGEDAKVVYELGVELFEGLAEAYQSLSPYDRGRLHGRVAGEIVSWLVSFGVGAAVKSTAVPQIISNLRRFDLVTANPRIATKLDEIVEVVQAIGRSDMCFAAGTLVVTAAGARPIETIERGELVLSRDALTGDSGYKRVTRTIVTHPSTTMTVCVGDEPIVCTPEHPFAVDRGGSVSFVPAGELVVGDALVTADGSLSTAIMTDIETSSGLRSCSLHTAASERLTTYNLEIADWHTYFVGTAGGGVWVHNTGTAACERVFAAFKSHRDGLGAAGDDAWDAFTSFLGRTSSDARRIKIDPSLAKSAKEVMTEVYQRAVRPNGTIDLDKVPTAGEIRSAMAGRLARAGLQTHHTVPKYLARQLWRAVHGEGSSPPPGWLDSMPGILMDRLEHTGGPGSGTASIHSIIRAKLPYGKRHNRQDIIGKLRESYEEFGRPEIWQVAEKWIIEQGV